MGRGGDIERERVIEELLFAHILISMGGLIGSSLLQRVNKVKGSSKLMRCHDDINPKVVQTLSWGCWTAGGVEL